MLSYNDLLADAKELLSTLQPAPSDTGLREALRPFSDLADWLDAHADERWKSPHEEFQCGDFMYSIGVGELHAARTAYRALQSSQPPTSLDDDQEQS